MDVGAGSEVSASDGTRPSEIDADILPELTDVDLEKLGVPLGHRKRLRRAISGLTAAETSAAPWNSLEITAWLQTTRSR